MNVKNKEVMLKNTENLIWADQQHTAYVIKLFRKKLFAL